MNAASLLPSGLPGGSLAPGMIFVIEGRQLGPFPAIESEKPVEELGGVFVEIAVGNGRWRALLLESGQDKIRAIVPKDVGIGQASVKVSYLGETGPPLHTRVVPTSVGFYSILGKGWGPASYDRFKRGDTVTLRATGLGNAGNSNELEVFIGSIKARKVTIQDEQLSFEIPTQAPSGCNIAIQARAAGFIPSNIVSIFIEPLTTACSSIESIRANLTLSGTIGFVLPYRLSMLVNLDPGQTESITGDAVVAGFRERKAAAGKRELPYPPAIGSCALYSTAVSLADFSSTVRTGLLSASEPLNIGEIQVAVDQWTGTVKPNKESRSYLYTVMGGTSPDKLVSDDPLRFRPGQMNVAGTGGVDVPAFNVAIKFPEIIEWTNRKDAAVVDQKKDFEVQWSVKEPSQLVAIAGASLDKPGRAAAAFLCLAKARDGRFKIPAPVLQSLPQSRFQEDDSLGYMFLGTVVSGEDLLYPLEGLDRLLGTGVSLSGRTTRWR